MKGSKNRKKIFFTCIVFMIIFMVLLIAALQKVTNTAYYEATAEAEIREMRQLYGIYSDLKDYYENSSEAFASVEYINDNIADVMAHVQASPEQSEKLVNELAEEFSHYIENANLYITDGKNILYMYNDGKNYYTLTKSNIQGESKAFATDSDMFSFLSANGFQEDTAEYSSTHIILKRLKYYEDISLIVVPQYDNNFDFAQNKIVIYGKYGNEELRLNTEPLENKTDLSNLGNNKAYKAYGFGKNKYIICYYSNQDEKGDYCIGIVTSLNLKYRYIIYAFLVLFFAVVSFGMWLWSERITKPLDFFLMWIKLIKDKEILAKGEEADTPMPKENYLLQNNIMLFFAFCLIPIIFAGALQWYAENQIINRYIEQRYAESAEFYGHILDEQYNIWRNPVVLLCNDDRIVEVLEKHNQEYESNYEDVFIQFLREYSYVMSNGSTKLTIYGTEGDVVFSYFNDLENDRYIKYRINVNEDYKWSFAEGLDMFNLYHKIYNSSGETVGYCRLELNSPNLHKGNSYNRDNLYSCYIYKYTDKVFNLLGSPGLTDENIIEMIRNPSAYPLTKTVVLENANMNYFYIIKDKVFFDRIWDKYAVTFLNVVFFIGIALIFAAGILTRMTLNPIIHISNALYTDSPRVPMSTMLLGKEEFALIVNRVKTLSEQVNEYAKEQKLLEAQRQEQEKKRKDAEMLTLQTQINPHFMYNIFSSIAVLIRTGQTEKATQMVMYTGNLMRMGLYRGHVMIPLKEEIEHVGQYIKIQQIRYNNCMEINFNIDEALMNLKVVKFILQPIVENAIEHNVGYLEGRNLQIHINAFIDGDVLIIEISDNGQGIGKEKIKKLQDSINNFDMSNHLGLANINERIKLNCGLKYGVILRNKEDFGLLVELVLPIVVEKEETDV